MNLNHLLDIHVFGLDGNGLISSRVFSLKQTLEQISNKFITQCVQS